MLENEPEALREESIMSIQFPSFVVIRHSGYKKKIQYLAYSFV